MSSEITTSPYVQPNIDCIQTPQNTIDLSMSYINSIQSEGVAGLVEKVTTLFMNDMMAAFIDFIFGSYKVKIAVDQQDPLAASIQLMETASGALISGIGLTYSVLTTGEKVLEAASKTTLGGWIANTLVRRVGSNPPIKEKIL